DENDVLASSRPLGTLDDDRRSCRSGREPRRAEHEQAGRRCAQPGASCSGVHGLLSFSRGFRAVVILVFGPETVTLAPRSGLVTGGGGGPGWKKQFVEKRAAAGQGGTVYTHAPNCRDRSPAIAPGDGRRVASRPRDSRRCTSRFASPRQQPGRDPDGSVRL